MMKSTIRNPLLFIFPFLFIISIIKLTGQVGIGTLEPKSKLHVSGTDDASPTKNGLAVFGPLNGRNIVIDQNEIMARMDSVVATLNINLEGGDIRFGGNILADSNITILGNAIIKNTAPFLRLDATAESDAKIIFTDADNPLTQKFEIAFNAFYQDLHFRSDDHEESNILTLTHEGTVGIHRAVSNISLNIKGNASETQLLNVEDADGDDQFTVLKNGTVGVGTTNSNVRLNVRGDTTDTHLMNIEDASGANKFSILESGLVAIGTNFPDALLDVNGEIKADSLRISSGAPLLRIDATDEADATLIFTDSQSPLDQNYEVTFNALDKDLHFRSGGLAGADVMTLLNTGEVGVGISEPVSKLHIGGTTDASLTNHGLTVFGPIDAENIVIDQNEIIARNNQGISTLNLNYEGGLVKLGGGLSVDSNVTILGQAIIKNASPLLRLDATDEADATLIFTDNQSPLDQNYEVTFNALDKDLHFRSGGLVGQDVMTLLDNGQVGIGTESPTARLHINSSSWPNLGVEGSSTSGTWSSIGNTSSGGKWFHFIATGSGNGGGPGKLMLYSSDAQTSPVSLAMSVDGSSGQVGIGTYEYADGYKLSVKGKLMADGVRVQVFSNWPDYVFDEAYQKPTLDQLEKFLSANHHLPGFHTAQVVEKEGLDIEEITVQQQEWLEVSTLYIIEQNKRISELEARLDRQSKQIESLLKLKGNE